LIGHSKIKALPGTLRASIPVIVIICLLLAKDAATAVFTLLFINIRHACDRGAALHSL
jgi:hypothetical protein